MTHLQPAKFTFNDLNEFITKSFEELCTYEERFRNQNVIEKYTAYIEQNKENLHKLSSALIALQCNQQFLDNGISYLDFILEELNRGITCFENNYQGPEYFTPYDVARIDLYNFILCVGAKMANINDMVDELNSKAKEMKKNVKSNPTEKMVQVMLKHLNLLEGINDKIFLLQEQIQQILFLEMVVMKRFNLKLKPC
ncbi:uncharacterized protein LOC123679665 [Harmonia axyridis]|uniref:uncharacterized protein LOC123679665 n=1 Tax=Harmonia axyridis TaxID=115357 RepID=UPI001E278DEA|nr:uncharacterized protein LOC123679665 [Harmonia axyridis]